MEVQSLVIFLVIGAAAGWIAGLLMRGGGFGLLGNIVVGIVGAVLGGFLFGLVGISAGSGLLGSLITAVIGALALLFTVGLVAKPASSVYQDARGRKSERTAIAKYTPARREAQASEGKNVTNRPQQQSPKTLTVFLSYRRADSADVVGRIYDRLLTVYDKAQIFKDVDSIPAGGDFRKYINHMIANTDVFLTVIGPDWLGRSERGKRIDDAGDYVRVELRSALRADIAVIPLLVRDAKIPAEDDLPEDIRALAYRNALPIRSDPDFNNDMSRLLTVLNKAGTKAYPS